jgi:hypothetical protein
MWGCGLITNSLQADNYLSIFAGQASGDALKIDAAPALFSVGGVCILPLWLAHPFEMDCKQWTSERPAKWKWPAVIGTEINAASEPRMPLGLIVFGGMALVIQVLWLGLIGWCLLNLF